MGYAFYADADAAPVKRPMYQYSAQNPWRFRYSTDANLADRIWRDEGVAFYISVGS